MNFHQFLVHIDAGCQGPIRQLQDGLGQASPDFDQTIFRPWGSPISKFMHRPAVPAARMVRLDIRLPGPILDRARKEQDP